MPERLPPRNAWFDALVVFVTDAALLGTDVGTLLEGRPRGGFVRSA